MDGSLHGELGGVTASLLPYMSDLRHKITSDSGDSVKPEHDTQPNGDAVPWGEGHLLSQDDESHKHEHSKLASSEDDNQGSSTDDQGDSTDGISTDSLSTSDDSQDKRSKHVQDASSSAQSSSDVTSLGTKSLPSPSRSTSSLLTGGISQHVSIPTANLPGKARPPIQTGSSSAGSACGALTCSQMGPGMSKVDNSVKLASAGYSQRDRRWKAAASVYWLFAAMLL